MCKCTCRSLCLALWPNGSTSTTSIYTVSCGSWMACYSLPSGPAWWLSWATGSARQGGWHFFFYKTCLYQTLLQVLLVDVFGSQLQHLTSLDILSQARVCQVKLCDTHPQTETHTLTLIQWRLFTGAAAKTQTPFRLSFPRLQLCKHNFAGCKNGKLVHNEVVF